jgi:hypothetical protein
LIGHVGSPADSQTKTANETDRVETIAVILSDPVPHSPCR